MKTLLLLLIAAICFASCKKEYKCECTSTTTYTYTGGPPPATTTNQIILEEKKRSDAQSKCDGHVTSTSSPGLYESSTTCKLL